jgi:IclR family transcriptional regulator, pca regulon regulatory protein
MNDLATPPPPALKAAMDDPAFVTSLARGLDVILAFGSGKRRMTISDVSRATGISRAAARRFLFTLTALGYLKTDGRDYSLTAKVLSLTNTYVTSTPLNVAAREIVDDIAAQSFDACSLAVLEGAEITFVARAATRRLISTSLQVGSRQPAHCSSLGRAILSGKTDAELDAFFDAYEVKAHTPHTITDIPKLKAIIRQVRVDGYAVVDQELEIGLRSIAVPVMHPSGGIEAALGVGSATHTIQELVDGPRALLLKGAADLSARMAY